jgi:hypothetical protein
MTVRIRILPRRRTGASPVVRIPPCAPCIASRSRTSCFAAVWASLGVGCGAPALRAAGGADPAVGAHAPLPTPLPLRLRRETHERGAPCLHPGPARGASRTRAPARERSRGSVRRDYLHPALWLRTRPERPRPHAGAGRRLHLRARPGSANPIPPAAPSRGGGAHARRHRASHPATGRGARRRGAGPFAYRGNADLSHREDRARARDWSRFTPTRWLP